MRKKLEKKYKCKPCVFHIYIYFFLFLIDLIHLR
jgi:hypothetical protein